VAKTVRFGGFGGGGVGQGVGSLLLLLSDWFSMVGL